MNLAEQELDRVTHIARQALGFYRETILPGRLEVAPLIDSVLSIYSNKLKADEVGAGGQIDATRCDGDAPAGVDGVDGVGNEVRNDLLELAGDGDNGRASVGDGLGALPSNSPSKTGVPTFGPEDADRTFEPFFTTKKDLGNLTRRHSVLSRP